MTLLPEVPDGSNYEAPQRSMSLTPRLSLADPTREILSRLGKMVGLSEHDAVERSIEPAVPTTVQTMPYQARGRRLQGATPA